MMEAFARTHICQTLQVSGIPSVAILSEFAFLFWVHKVEDLALSPESVHSGGVWFLQDCDVNFPVIGLTSMEVSSPHVPHA